MLSYPKALHYILNRVPQPKVHSIALSEALTHVLASEILADLDIPPFDKSFMDGFAVDSRDVASLPVELEIVGTSAAGRMPESILSRGQAIRIMTGAPLPRGADAVQMVEKTESAGTNRVRILEAVVPGQHIAPRASEVQVGTPVLEVGRILMPPDLAVLATFGRSEVPVFRKPHVTIIATGDELVDIRTKPGPGQIRNSNSHMLAAQCRLMGLNHFLPDPLADDPRQIRQAIRRALEDSDLLLFSGGVSMGDFDFVHKVLAAEGIDIIFHKAAIKPGKPLIAGRRGEKLIFGLPGNPVSAFVTFAIFVKPALDKWMGKKNPTPNLIQAELMQDVRQKPGRLFFKPAATVSTPVGFQTRPIETKGSADIVAFSRANSLLLVGADISHLQAGSAVSVLPLERELPSLGFDY